MFNLNYWRRSVIQLVGNFVFVLISECSFFSFYFSFDFHASEYLKFELVGRALGRVLFVWTEPRSSTLYYTV